MGTLRREIGMKTNTKSIIKKIMTYATLSIICFLFIAPFLWMVRSSLLPLVKIFETPIQWIPDQLEFKNYYDAMTILPFAKFFMNSSFIVCTSVVGILISASLAAFGFARLNWKGRDVIFGVLLTTLMLPSFVTLIPTFIGWQKLGVINTYIPLILPNWLCGGAAGALSGVFYIFLLRQFFMGIPKELDEAALIDGASFFRVYAQVILPLAKPAIMVVVLFASFNIWNDYLSPSVYLNDVDKYTLNLGLNLFAGMYNAQWNLMMAAAAVATVPPVIIFILGQKYFIEGVALSGIKG